MKHGVRRSVLAFLVAATALALAGLANADSYPAKPVRIVVPLTAGGLSDVLTRQIAQQLNKVWGQPVIVENRPGANTIIGASMVAKAEPDGYTMLMSNPASVSINQYMYRELPYDPERDLTPVFNVAATPWLIVSSPSLPVTTMKELVNAARGQPGQLAYGSFGNGSASHLATEVFSLQTGIKMLHVPYKGVAEVLPAVASGQVQMAFAAPAPALGLIKAGKVRALAVGAPQRVTALPNVPTMEEAGFPPLKSNWFGIVMPSATPRAIVDKVAADLSRLFKNPEFREKTLTSVGLIPLLQGPQEFDELLRDERIRHSRLIKDLRIPLQ